MPKKQHKTFSDFCKRWNIPINEDEKFLRFKNRALNAISEILGDAFCKDIHLRNEYLDLIGQTIEFRHKRDIWIGKPSVFDETRVHDTLNTEQDNHKYIYYLEEIFKVSEIDGISKDNLFEEFGDIIKDTGVSINLKKTPSGIIFYPSGAKLLDDKLVNDNLVWLQDYPELYKHFEAALKLYQKNEFGRNLLDNLRFIVEQLLKTVLENNSPIEKQKENLGKFLKEKGINKEIREMYTTLITFFTNYQNETVKHNDKHSPKEVEFMIYLTGVFIRLLLQITMS